MRPPHASTSDDSPRRGGGALLGIAALVRPIAGYLVPIAVLGLVVGLLAARVPARCSVFLATAYATPAFLLVGGWILRNERVAHARTLAPIAGHQLLHRRAAAVLARVRCVPLTSVQEELGIREAYFRFRGPDSERELFGTHRYEELFPNTASMPLPELDRRWTQEALEVFRSHPGLTVGAIGIGVLEVALAPPTLILLVRYGVFRPSPDVMRSWENQEFLELGRALAAGHPVVFVGSALCVLLLTGFWVLVLRGAVRAPRLIGVSSTAALAVVLLYLLVISSLSDAMDDRFRLPQVPVGAIFAGLALSSRDRNDERRREPRAAPRGENGR